MSTPKLIIYVPGNPRLQGFKMREFQWSEPHKKYLYRNKEFDPVEFNQVMDKALLENEDMHPRVMVIVEPKSETLDLPNETTIEEALAIIRAKAPQLLKRSAAA
jgi:hypothetical protein